MADAAAERVLLELEVETAWAAQKHHERLAEALRSELEMQAHYCERLKVKARGFDRLARLLSAENVAWGDLTEVAKTVTHKVDLLLELQGSDAK